MVVLQFVSLQDPVLEDVFGLGLDALEKFAVTQ